MCIIKQTKSKKRSNVCWREKLKNREANYLFWKSVKEVMRCSGLLDDLTTEAGGRKPTWEHSGAKVVLWNTEVTWWSAWLSGGGRRFHRLAGNESPWSKVTPKIKTRETPGSLNLAANFRRGTSRSELVKSPFGWPRKPRRLTPHASALFTSVSENNQVSGPCGFPGDLRR